MDIQLVSLLFRTPAMAPQQINFVSYFDNLTFSPPVLLSLTVTYGAPRAFLCVDN